MGQEIAVLSPIVRNGSDDTLILRGIRPGRTVGPVEVLEMLVVLDPPLSGSFFVTFPPVFNDSTGPDDPGGCVRLEMREAPGFRLPADVRIGIVQRLRLTGPGRFRIQGVDITYTTGSSGTIFTQHDPFTVGGTARPDPQSEPDEAELACVRDADEILPGWERFAPS